MKNKKYCEWNDIENTTYQNLWEAVIAVFRGIFIIQHIYWEKDLKSIVSAFVLRIQKKLQMKPKESRRREAVKSERKAMKKETEKQQGKIKGNK